MGVKRRKTRGITITKIGPSNNQILGLLITGVVIGGVAVYTLPIIAPEIYRQIDRASGGFLTGANNAIHGGLRFVGLEK